MTDMAGMPTPAAADDPVPDGAVVVGLDGSAKDDAVLELATEEAMLLGAPLHLVMAHEIHAGLIGAWDAGFVPTGIELDVADAGARMLERAVEDLRTRRPDVGVTRSHPWGTPSQALVSASDRARRVVVGSGRKGSVEQALLGTTSLDTAMHARCPVIVVGPERGNPEGPVVVGVDVSAHSLPAARLAMEEADLRGVPLVVVTTWWLEVVDGMVVTEPGTPQWDLVDAKYRHAVDDVLAPARAEHPAVRVEVDVRNARPVPTLVEVAADASLLVVGSRGRGGFSGAALGSVSHKVLQRAHCPIAVSRETEHHPGQARSGPAIRS